MTEGDWGDKVVSALPPEGEGLRVGVLFRISSFGFRVYFQEGEDRGGGGFLLPQDERPRERLRKVGVDNLSLPELLALVIEKGQRGKNVLTIAQNLISHFGNLAKMKEAI